MRDQENHRPLKETPWLTIQELSQYLSVSVGTVRNWVSQRYIPFARRGRVVRFHREKIDQWLMSGACRGRLNHANGPAKTTREAG